MKDDSISLINSKSSVPICSICHVRTEKQESGFCICPQCQRSYDPQHEIVQYEDTLLTGYEDELREFEGTSSGVGLISEESGSATDDLYKKTRRLGVADNENVTEGEIYYPESGTTESL